MWCNLWIGNYEFKWIILRLRRRNHKNRSGVCDGQRLEQDLKGDSKQDLTALTWNGSECERPLSWDCAGNEGSRLWAGNEMKSKEMRWRIIRIRCRIKATIYGKWIWFVRIRSSSLETCDNGTVAGRRNRGTRRNWDRDQMIRRGNRTEADQRKVRVQRSVVTLCWWNELAAAREGSLTCWMNAGDKIGW